MSDDVKAMVNQWVFRQSLGPITPIAFLEELKRLLKQWGKKAMKCCFAVVWNNAKWGTSKNIEFFAENPISCHGRLSSVYPVVQIARYSNLLILFLGHGDVHWLLRSSPELTNYPELSCPDSRAGRRWNGIQIPARQWLWGPNSDCDARQIFTMICILHL